MTGAGVYIKVAVASCQENGLQISLVEAWEMQEADLRFAVQEWGEDLVDLW